MFPRLEKRGQGGFTGAPTVRNWQPLLRRVNSRTSKGSMSLLQQRGLSVTEVVVEVGGNVLLDTERCPSELIIICAPSTPPVSYQEAAT